MTAEWHLLIGGKAHIISGERATTVAVNVHAVSEANWKASWINHVARCVEASAEAMHK